MRRFHLYSGLMVAMLLIMPIGGINAAQKDRSAKAAKPAKAEQPEGVLDHTMKDIDGKSVNLADAERFIPAERHSKLFVGKKSRAGPVQCDRRSGNRLSNARSMISRHWDPKLRARTKWC